MLDFNTEPYYDDFSDTNKFYRILFRPSYPVQARELTQLQSILQNQIKSHGDHIFSQGAMVIPGEFSVDTKYSYVKLVSTYSGININNYINDLVGTRITGSNGATAEVLYASIATSTDPATIYVRYVTSNSSSNSVSFLENEILTSSAGVVQVQSLLATGLAAAAIIKQGVYYVNGYFVLCEAQTIILEKYSNIPSYRIGLTATESIVTPEENETLLDNAQSSYNYSAPGAHRYYIDLTLSKLSIGAESDTNFIELGRIVDGKTASIVTTTDYSILEKTLARRTYDESGNYTVTPFNIDVREHRNNSRGSWLASRQYQIGDIVTNSSKYYVARNDGTAVTGTGPVHTAGKVFDGVSGVEWEYTDSPVYNRGIYDALGKVRRIDIINQGSGYTTVPDVVISGGSGTGATAVAKINNGKVISIVITNNGSGYTSNPNVAITGVGTLASATAFADFGTKTKLAIGMEPGKAYIQGYEIEKPAIEFVSVDKARDTNTTYNGVISSTIGNYVLVTNITGIPDFKANETVTLYNKITGTGTAVGTAKVRCMEWDNGTLHTSSATYKLYLFEIKVNSGYTLNRDVKSFSGSSFLADIKPVYQVFTGQSITSYTAAGYATQGSGLYLRGAGTSFLTSIKAGDYLWINATTLSRVVTITNNQDIIIDTAAINVIGAPISLATTKIVESNNQSLVFPIADKTISAVTDITYTVFERFTGSTNGSGAITLTADSGVFASTAASGNYLAITAAGAVVAPTSYGASGSGTITLTFASNLTTAFVISAAVNKSSLGAFTKKTKTTNYTNIVYTNATATKATATILPLGVADCFRIVSVKMDTGTFASPTGTYSIDISDRYDFDDGQRLTYYDYSRLVLKPSFVPPTAPVQVYFEYFTHGAGDYFIADSYSGVDYAKIPFFNGDSLANSFDFRPRVTDGVTNASTFSSQTFLPKRGTDLICDYTYYLPRKDKIAIDFNGVFFDLKGIPTDNPSEPLDPAMGMVLYNISLYPYTMDTSTYSVQFSKVENKRYTMRDIGKLEKRIDNIEYYTSLSLLEQDTVSLKIADDSGLDRLKNGFIVDSFNGHGVGNPTSPDYLCAMDMENNELRPFFTMQNINLLEKKTNDVDRAANNYKMYGDIVTLPVLDHIKVVEQQYGSRTEYINPFAIFTFLGDMSITPASDDWFETLRMPDVVNNVEGNFNTLQILATKSGALGTVWNAWQTQWAGAIVTTGRWGTNQGSRGRGMRSYVTETYAQNIGQSRTGINTKIVAKIDTQLVEDRILSTAAIPYMRSRNVLVQVKGLKPNTRFYPFFDNIDISSYCTPATRMVYTVTSGIFDDNTNVGSLSSETARRINGDSEVCLTKGDIVYTLNRGVSTYTVTSSPATGVVVGKEYNASTGAYSLFIQAIKGSFLVSDTIKGTVSLAVGIVSITPTVALQSNNLISNINGSLNLLYNIPNNSAIRFRTGTREFKLVDVPGPNDSFGSRGLKNYEASGILQTKQSTFTATRNAELVQEPLTENRVIVESTSRIVSDTGWYDPLAQTFLIQNQPGGCFLSKIDIFFARKDANIPVTLEIREVVNGYPGKRILPFSRTTLQPEQVNLSVSNVTVDGVTYPKYDTATTFNFSSPVYVQNNGEYALVLLSDSDQYKVWISQMGDAIPDSTNTISQQPYNGVLFKSQNASTWTACQDQDLKFAIYRAKFDISNPGTIEFINDVIPLIRVTKNSDDAFPFQTTLGSNIVRVWQQDHGMPYDIVVGSKVTIAGITSNVNGIPLAELNGTKTISNVDCDSYTFTTTTVATVSGYGGPTGSTEEWTFTKNIQYDAIHPSIQVQSFPETSSTFSMKTAAGRSIDGTETPYNIDSSFVPCFINDTNYFSTPRMIVSEINETHTGLSNTKPLSMVLSISSTSNALSPIVDTHRTSAILVSNKINAPTKDNMNVAVIDTVTSFTHTTGAFTFVVAGADTYLPDASITSTIAGVRTAMATIKIGSYITISGATTSGNNKQVLVTGYKDDGTTGKLFVGSTLTGEASISGTTITNQVMFYDEITPDGSSSISKYVSTNVKLANMSTYLRIKLSANVPNEANVLVYYRTSHSSDLSTVTWKLISSDSSLVKVINGDPTFYDTDYSALNLTPFDTVAVKIVMQSTNSSAVPRIKDLRIIACA